MVTSEYFWWLAVLALVAAGGIVAVLSWRPTPEDEPDFDADALAEGDDATPVGRASPPADRRQDRSSTQIR